MIDFDAANVPHEEASFLSFQKQAFERIDYRINYPDRTISR
jgi:hypothetical protein